jgi:hypothetical protein
VVLAAIAVVPFTGPLGGAAVGAVLFLGTVAGVLLLSERDGCSVLSLLVVLLLLVPQDYVLVGPLKSVGSPAILVGLGALAIWVAARILTLTHAAEMHPVRWVLLFFALTSLASYAAGMVRDLTAAEAASMDRVVFQHLALLGVALLAVDALESPDRLTLLLERLVLVGGVASVIGILEFTFTGFDFREVMLLPGLTTNVELVSDTRSGFDRIAAGASHPIEFSVVTAALVPLALHLSLHAATGRWRYRLALVAMLVAVPMSVSRSGFLTLAVGLAFYTVALSPRGRLNALVLGLIGLGLFRAAVPGLLGTVRSLFRDVGTDPSIAGRTDDYAAIPGLMEGNWWLGRGLGTFLPDVYFFLDNQYLGSLLTGGVVGLVAFLALHVVGIGVARGVRHRTRDPELASEGQALAATIAAFGVAAIAFDALSFKQSAFLLFLLLGCAGARWTMVRDLPKLWHADRAVGERPAHDPDIPRTGYVPAHAAGRGAAVTTVVPGR